MNDAVQHAMARRNFLRHMLLGSGLWGLRSLAVGLPASWLMRPQVALAAVQRAIDQRDAPALAPQYLILSTSGSGDPLNCNAPGTYDDSNILHPSASSMAASSVNFGSYSGKAALPWASLDPATCARTAFIHHATGTGIHSDEPKVLTLLDNVVGVNNTTDALSAAFARQLAPALGTVQVAPVALGAAGPNENVVFEGRPQPMLTPSSLFSLLGHPTGPLQNLQALRDADLNAINSYFRSRGTPGQQYFLDSYITSQTQVRSISDALLNQLAAITDNSAPSQISAALTLVQMKVSPVFSIHIPFGGDNHLDNALEAETAQTISGVAAIKGMAAQIAAANLSTSVTFASLNVFGRTMAKNNAADNANGRSHNAAHHVTVLMGPNVKAGVCGGVAATGGDYSAVAFDSATGSASSSGNVTVASGLASAGVTVGAALGIPLATLQPIIPSGTVVTALIA